MEAEEVAMDWEIESPADDDSKKKSFYFIHFYLVVNLTYAIMKYYYSTGHLDDYNHYKPKLLIVQHHKPLYHVAILDLPQGLVDPLLAVPSHQLPDSNLKAVQLLVTKESPQH